MREAWVQECFDMVASGFNGCMVDRWTRTPFGKHAPGFDPADESAFVAGRDNATSALAKRAKAENVYLVGEGDQVDAISDPGYGYNVKASLRKQIELAKSGQGLLASYKPGSTGSDFTTQLASFLIGAAPGHFFGAGSWTVNHTSREGVTWHPEYEKPLGAPLGDAVQTGDVFSRRFAYGTNVTFDTKTSVGTITWGSFPATD